MGNHKNRTVTVASRVQVYREDRLLVRFVEYVLEPLISQEIRFLTEKAPKATLAVDDQCVEMDTAAGVPTELFRQL